jgi:hypothetical protein
MIRVAEITRIEDVDISLVDDLPVGEGVLC